MDGSAEKPADIEKLWDWLFEHARECEYAILSVDTLVYGNIVGSRIHQFSQETCMERMEAFRRLKQMNPALHIHAYNLVARVLPMTAPRRIRIIGSNTGTRSGDIRIFLTKRIRGRQSLRKIRKQRY